jgi:hypothetical protein
MDSLEILSAVNIGLGIAGMIGILILAWIITSILVYLVAKLFNSDVSFEEAFGATILSEIISFIIITIMLELTFGSELTFSLFILMISDLYLWHIYWRIWTIQIIAAIINFIAVLSIYKTAFKVGWRAAFVISILAFIIMLTFNQNLPIILYDIAFIIPIFGFGPVTWGMFTVNTPAGEMAIQIDEIIELFILGFLISTILIYLVAKLLNINISFLRTLIANIFPGMVSFIIIIISFLLSMLENNNVAFFIGVGVAFIVASIIYRYIPNVNWRKSILMSTIISVLWFIIGVFKLPIYIYFMICC